MKRCNSCIKYEVIHTLCEKCKELNELETLLSGDCVELPKIDMGQAIRVSPEEKQALWSNDDEKRMDVIGPNGNDGDHYKHVVKIGGRSCGKTLADRQKQRYTSSVLADAHKPWEHI